ncbi:hypothetical protein cypCar_00007366 [Cyprinus carpio]|nr:hypothetical protein cypCar_00007366 [Cyprinus carpio]
MHHWCSLSVFLVVLSYSCFSLQHDFYRGASMSGYREFSSCLNVLQGVCSLTGTVVTSVSWEELKIIQDGFETIVVVEE